jgi:hypothetical protein
VRNSISAVAQSVFDHNALQGMDRYDMMNMLLSKNIDWNTDYNYTRKIGATFVKTEKILDLIGK